MSPFDKCVILRELELQNPQHVKKCCMALKSRYKLLVDLYRIKNILNYLMYFISVL